MHQIDALNFKMCKMFLYIKYIPPGSMPRTLLGGSHRCHLFQEHGEARPCLMQPLLIFCSNSWPFFCLIPDGDLWRNVLWWSGLEWVVGRVLGWVVGLACARATFNTGMFMMKLLPEHKIVYNKVIHRSSLIILLSKCTRLMHWTLKCAKCSYI